MRLEITDTRTLTDDNPVMRNLEFRGGVVTVGSHSDSLVQIPDIKVAAHHATIERQGEAWIYRPKTRDESQTKLNDKPIGSETELKDGDVLVITYFEIRVHIDASTGEVEATQVGRLGELAMIKQYPVPPRTTVRKPEEKVSLSAPRQKAIAEFVSQLRSCRDLPSLMEMTLKVVEAELSARMVWMGIRPGTDGPLEFMDGRLDRATSMIEPPKLETYSFRCLNRHQHLCIPRTGDGVTQSVLAVPILTGNNAIGLLYVDSRRHERIYDDADLDFITLIAGLLRPPVQAMASSGDILIASNANDNDTNGIDVEASVGVDTRWSLVHQFREKMEPKKLPQWPTLQLAQHSIKGIERAGDILDVVRMPNGLVAVLCGHAKSEPARTAMAISQIQGAFRIAALHADPPRIQLRALNWLISDAEHPCSFDAAIAVINPKSGAFEISTAGRVGAFHVGKGGVSKSLVFADAPSVGNGEVVEYKGQTAKLEVGDSLVLFTAGAADTKNAEGEKLGAKRLISTISDGLGQSAAQALDDLVADLSGFLQVGQQAVDATIILAYRGG